MEKGRPQTNQFTGLFSPFESMKFKSLLLHTVLMAVFSFLALFAVPQVMAEGTPPPPADAPGAPAAGAPAPPAPPAAPVAPPTPAAQTPEVALNRRKSFMTSLLATVGLADPPKAHVPAPPVGTDAPDVAALQAKLASLEAQVAGMYSEEDMQTCVKAAFEKGQTQGRAQVGISGSVPVKSLPGVSTEAPKSVLEAARDAKTEAEASEIFAQRIKAARSA